MIVYKGLLENNAIKVGDSFVVNLPSGYYRIKDQVFTGNNQVVIHKDLIKTLERKVPEKQELSHYISKNAKIISIEDYSNYQKELSSYWDNYDYQYDFTSLGLEEEYKIRKKYEDFLTSTPVYNKKEEYYENYYDNINVVGEQVDTGSKFIQTSYSVGFSSYSKNGVFKVLTSQIMMDEFNNIINNHKEWKVEIPTHSFMQYIKINGCYVFIKDDCYKTIFDKIFAELDSAKDYEESIRKKVRSDLYTRVSKEVLGDNTRGEVYDKLQGIRSRVSDLDIKKASSNKKYYLIDELNKLIDSLKIKE